MAYGRKWADRAHTLSGGKERLFTNVSLDHETPGWLYVMRLDVDSAPLSGIVAPIAGYRFEALKGWEYVQGTEKDPLIDTSVSG